MKNLICICLMPVMILSFQASFSQNRVTLDSINQIYVFNGATYEMYDLQQIDPESIEVTSELKSNHNKYSKAGLIDKNYNSAWVEGIEGDGVGEKITFMLSTLPDVIEILPGYYKSNKLWEKNNRVSKIEIRMFQTGNDVPIDELQISFMSDTKGSIPRQVQYINISDLTEQNMDYEEFDRMEIEILAVDSINSIYSDTCISEISLMRRNKFLGSISYEDYKNGKHN